MSHKGKKRSKSNPPTKLRTSQITFENTRASTDVSKCSIECEGIPENLQQERPLDIPGLSKEDKEHVSDPEVAVEPRKPFTPIVYTFRVPVPQPSKGVRRGAAKCPPYHLQLDHTLAVIWTLFSSEEAKKPLGIAQLQWALEFLKGILNRKGEHPKDVSLCIDAIQEELLQQYSDLVDDIKTIKIPCYNDLESSLPESPESCRKTEEGNFKCDSDSCLRKFGLDEEKSEDMITKTIPFSINYADMIKKSPPCVEQLYTRKQASVCSTGPQQYRASGTGCQLEQDISRENMVGFLKNWRREQVEKIQSELKRLRSIENFISNVDNENFTPYVDERQLDDLVSASKTSKSSKSERIVELEVVESSNKKKPNR